MGKLLSKDESLFLAESHLSSIRAEERLLEMKGLLLLASFLSDEVDQLFRRCS